ncbi:MAG: hypothetical protein A3C07_03805 [Candidatus Sungbacteria bacterium RIFCSPHIGHO2_02_FULL_47_11]|uniref:DUF1653 domain-containing protein n=1 Tax=Candidatus Sungbacteria bacterium RIFCSPHIGHO2_02_FULL_47_11 TaxID=1802270 RepID=A0A1G2KMT9_9BACT|nr:MAG: hypothetical protein A3C07_03805 [Candidatus Sungbacteria bacterium RIFCSPHIGHO2_02_FULL_47_11]
MGVRPGVYRHYKGNLYEVIGMATGTETREQLVVYRALYGEFQLFVRPFKMFVQDIESQVYSGPRFVPVKLF